MRPLAKAISSGIIISCLIFSHNCVAQEYDPFDTSEILGDSGNKNSSDAQKTEDELIAEAFSLQAEERLLDYRSKLLTLVRRFPNNLTAHILLSEYYLKNVGHFRLSLRYAKRATELFNEQHGNPPFNQRYSQSLHSSLLGLTSEVRLNLDDYQGALSAIEEMEKNGYFEFYLPSSKAWILMKLKRIDDAINVARAGLLLGSAPGHTLNVLGILLSVSKKRAEAIRTFGEAIDYELSLGSAGSASTPLNNVGEVYRETFQEDLAIDSWERALRLPDGCEHILPSMNLAVIHLEGLKIAEARDALQNFESCFAQFPLKNEEEHKAIIYLAKGRIAWLSGYVDDAIDHFQTALNKQQWFGKIGTSKEDLEVAIRLSLILALESKNEQLKNSFSWTIQESGNKILSRIKNRANILWQLRKARLLLFNKLDNFQDLYVRHSDSMLDYSWLGISLRDVNRNLTKKIIGRELATDDRRQAVFYYNTYLAENLLAHGKKNEARELLKDALKSCREPHDLALKTNILRLLAGSYEPSSAQYQDYVRQLFKISPATLRNFGLQLAVQNQGLNARAKKILSSYNFIFSDDATWGLSYKQGKTLRLELRNLNGNNIIHFMQGTKEEETFRDFIEAVFYQQH